MSKTKPEMHTTASTSLFAHLFTLALAAGLPLLAILGPNQQFADVAIAAGIGCGLVAVVSSIVMRVPFLEWALTPVGVMLCFMVLAFGVVPVLWALGLAVPWEEVLGREKTAAQFGILLLIAFALGVWISNPHFERGSRPTLIAGARLSSFLLWCSAVGILGYLLLALVAGGPMALLYSLADRRDSLAGTGPLRALLLVAAVGCVVGVAHQDKTTIQNRLTWLCGITYFSMNLLTGARVQALIVVIAAFAVHVRIHGSTRAIARRIALAMAVAIPASTFYALRVRQGLTYGTDVQVVDDSTTRSALASLVGPFVNGGVDSLRTLGVVSESAPTFTLNVTPLLGSLANVIPRSLWPNKPDGSATDFSARYFPDRWADGTGVPPSISAEMLNTFGVVGGLIGMAVLGVVVARISSNLHGKKSLWALVIGALLTADTLQLVKGGSDGFVRSVGMQAGALLIAVVLARVSGLSSPARARTPDRPKARLPTPKASEARVQSLASTSGGTTSRPHPTPDHDFGHP